MSSSAPALRIGTSGYNYDHWKERFYPPDLPSRLWLEHYARHFDTVEINNSFYRLPAEKTWEGWRRQAPEHFLYAVKANRYITHNKKLRDAADSVELMMGRVRLLKKHLGPILWQLPPNWNANPDRLTEFLPLLPDDVRHALEFRNPSWWDNDRVLQLLDDYGVAFVSHDMPDQPAPRLVTGGWVYVRFHGGEEKFAAENRPAMQPWIDWLAGCRAKNLDIYAYFNNDNEGHAVTDAQALRAAMK
jgi:uncharacterized protein YecE (DUF72 family)